LISKSPFTFNILLSISEFYFRSFVNFYCNNNNTEDLEYSAEQQQQKQSNINTFTTNNVNQHDKINETEKTYLNDTQSVSSTLIHNTNKKMLDSIALLRSKVENRANTVPSEADLSQEKIWLGIALPTCLADVNTNNEFLMDKEGVYFSYISNFLEGDTTKRNQIPNTNDMEEEEESDQDTMG